MEIDLGTRQLGGRLWKAGRPCALALAVATFVAGCGGGGTDAGQTEASEASTMKATAAAAPAPPGTAPTRNDAIRFLNQATFGATESDIQRVISGGYAAWIDAQLAMPGAQGVFYARFKADDAAARAGGTLHASNDSIYDVFYAQALSAPDQLRQRVAFALSQILVVSTAGVTGDAQGSTASYADLLHADAFASYRQLLQDVSMHPAMGVYLSSLGNRKEDPTIGRTADQNYAREILQLFSIGLSRLNLDGTLRLNAEGRSADTYTQDDVIGLAKVFTGWSWAGPDASENRFQGKPVARDANRLVSPMQAYSQWHSTSEKKFLGVSIPAQTTADPAGDLRTALDMIAKHPNVAPFISRQLIQRLVTTNPSAGYVRRIATVFNDNGAGTRGDLKAVVRAILLDAEARGSRAIGFDSFGKLREPVIRMTAFLRAYNAKSDSGKYLIGDTDDPGLALGQTPLHADTVFNFYRPGYVPPETTAGDAGLTVPEMQLTSEASVAGYVNFMSRVVERGIGQQGTSSGAARADVQADLSAELAVSDNSTALVDKIAGKLLCATDVSALKAQIVTAVDSVPVPKASGRNDDWIQSVKRRRVNIALLLTLASPEYLVQR